MKIASLRLKDFKRFTELTISHIPGSKLVLLIGSNGSGKSSVFDAFEYINRVTKGEGNASGFMLSYLNKNNNPFDISIELDSGETSRFTSVENSPGGIGKFSFYGRTSFRQVPRLTRTQLGQAGKVDVEKDSDRPRLFIEKDNRFENDIEKISEQVLREIFRDKASSEEIQASYITPINAAFDNIFGGSNGTKISLIEIIPPLDGNVAQINFKKGGSEIHYNYLSAGEKEVVNILFNLLVRRDRYHDSIYFFDEIDLHLNTKLQFNLLKEITENWIPDDCQFWTASHSLGFIDYARQSEQASIIDFDDFDFDKPQKLIPQPKDTLDVFDIAVPKRILFDLLRDKKLIVCENRNDDYYNLLLIPGVIFVGVKDSRDVFLNVKKDSRYHSLRDRDFLSDQEVLRIRKKYPNHHILEYYDFENYIYHPDNIEELKLKDFNKQAYVDEITKQKNERLLYILPNIVSARQTYEEFKSDDKLRDNNPDSIVDDFKSSDFERFYKFFDMKDQFNKVYLAAMNLTKEQLVSTKWLKGKITGIIND